jgi:H+/Cl- antiporter ClcA
MGSTRADPQQHDLDAIPPTLGTRQALNFWLTIICTGLATGLAAGLLTLLLEWVERLFWGRMNVMSAAAAAPAAHHLWVLLGAGALTGGGQLVLQRLTSANGIDITEAITRHAGRLPALRTLGSAVLSILVVGMGASLGREGAPKQFGAVIANKLADRARLSDEQRRLLVACGAGAGMAAAYGVPLGGALFALEVLRGVLALRLILPDDLGDRDRDFMADAAQCANLFAPGISAVVLGGLLEHDCGTPYRLCVRGVHPLDCLG